MSLADLYAVMEQTDQEMVKEAEEFEKIAAEEEAAGRIMARGFMDELNKLGEDMKFKPVPIKQTNVTKGSKGPGGAVPGPRPSSVVGPGAGAGTTATQKKFQKGLYEK